MVFGTCIKEYNWITEEEGEYVKHDLWACHSFQAVRNHPYICQYILCKGKAPHKIGQPLYEQFGLPPQILISPSEEGHKGGDSKFLNFYKEKEREIKKKLPPHPKSNEPLLSDLGEPLSSEPDEPIWKSFIIHGSLCFVIFTIRRSYLKDGKINRIKQTLVWRMGSYYAYKEPVIRPETTIPDDSELTALNRPRVIQEQYENVHLPQLRPMGEPRDHQYLCHLILATGDAPHYVEPDYDRFMWLDD